MSNLGQTIATIRNPAATPERYTRRRTAASRAGYVAVVLVAVAVLISSIAILLDAWRTGSPDAWQSFWRAPLNLLGISPSFLLFRREFHGNLFQPFMRIAVVRQDAIAGDNSTAPLANEQPALPNASLLHDRGVEINKLVHPSTLHRTSIGGVAISLLTLAFMTGLTAFVLFFVFLGTSNPSVGIGLIVFVPITALLIVVGTSTMRRYRRGNLPLTVILDGLGVRWSGIHGRHREQRILWDEAQAFVTIHWLDSRTVTRYTTVYALLAPNAVLAWELTDKASREQQAASRELAGIIAARTGLPLRDLTSALEAAIKPSVAPAKPKIRFPLGSPGTPDAVPGIPPVAAGAFVEADPHATHQLFRLSSLVALAAVPVMLVYGAGFGLQQIQPRYFDALLSSAEAQSPLYLDALNEADYQWPVQQGTPSDPRDYAFTEDAPLHGVYQLSGSDPQSYMYAWEFQSFSDGVVEVTTRYPKNASSDAIGGIGLILRERGDGNQFVKFQVDPWGDWELWDFSQLRNPADNWREIADGHNTAIHLGVSAINRVAVLMRGNHFLLYVNGVFLGAATDSNAPTSGPVGVYVDNDSPGGQFFDFAVYPLSNGMPYLL